MNKRGHRNGGTALLAVSLVVVQPDIITGAIMVAGIYFGSFLPDLDADYSYFRKVFKPVAVVYDLLPKNDLFKHRGLFLHSILTLLWLGGLYYYCELEWFLWVILGVIGHHFLDSLTPMGLKKYFIK